MLLLIFAAFAFTVLCLLIGIVQLVKRFFVWLLYDPLIETPGYWKYEPPALIVPAVSRDIYDVSPTGWPTLVATPSMKLGRDPR